MMQQMGQNNVNNTSLYRVLSTPPVFNEGRVRARLFCFGAESLSLSLHMGPLSATSLSAQPVCALRHQVHHPDGGGAGIHQLIRALGCTWWVAISSFFFFFLLL